MQYVWKVQNDMGTGDWPQNRPAQYILVPIRNPFPHRLLHATPSPPITMSVVPADFATHHYGITTLWPSC